MKEITDEWVEETLSVNEDNLAMWYEIQPGHWSISSDPIARIEMGIKEIVWRLRKNKGEENEP